MKVLLTADVKDLGKAGDIRNVAEGYARNFLIPRGLAVAATEENVRKVQQQKEAQARREAKALQEMQAVASRIEGVELRFQAHVGEQDRLYGSITTADIARELSQKIGREIDKHSVVLEEPIRELGTFKVQVRLGRGAAATINVVVERG